MSHNIYQISTIFKTDNLTKIVSQYNKLSNAVERYNNLESKSVSFRNSYNKALQNSTTNMGKYLASLNGAKASLTGYISYLAKTKASTIALQVSTRALSIAMNVGFAVGMTLLINQINKWIHAQEEARQKAIELTNTYQEQQKSLDSQIEKYKELKEKLDEGNLSTSDSRDIKEQLLEIQKELIESFGNEASNIDLVNGKYREQLGLLSELSKEKASDYIAENKANYEKAKKELEKVRTYNAGTLFSYNPANGLSEQQKVLYDYIKSYSNLFDLRDQYDTSTFGNDDRVVTLFVKADVKSADDTMHQFAEDIRKWSESTGIDINNLLDGISKQIPDKTWTDKLKEYKEIYDEYIKAEIVRNDTLRPLYSESIKAVEEYNNALSFGEGVEEAKAHLDEIQQSVQSVSSTVEGSQDVFDGIYDGINKVAETEYNLNQQFENNDSVKNYAEQLRGLTDSDLKVINFEDNVESPGEKAFGSLIELLELSKDDVQLLINKLVELGIVQGKIDSTIPHKSENSLLGDKLVTSKESIEEFTSSVKSAYDAYSTLMNPDVSSTDALSSILTISESVKKMGRSVNWEFIEKGNNSVEKLGNAIEYISKEYANSVLAGADIDVNSKFGQMLANNIVQVQKATTELSVLNNQIDSLESAYDSLTEIVDTYNETGYITFDQLQTLLALEPQYLNCLIDEQGQLVLNQQSMLDLANQRLNDAEAQAVQQAIAELGTAHLRDEASAVRDSGSAFSEQLGKLATYNATLTETISKTALTAESVRELNAALRDAESNGASKVQVGNILDNLNNKLKLIGNTRTNLSKNFGNIVGSKSKNSSSGSGSDSAKDFEELVDFFERRVEVLNNSISLLDKNIENVVGSFAKNNLLNGKRDIYSEMLNNYSSALNMYKQKADEALSKLPADIAQKAKDGAINITTFLGESNEAVVEAIKDYQDWAGKVQDCSEQLAELKTTLRQLELEKFNNIIEDFTKQFDIRQSAGIDLISKQIDLFSEAGELIGESFYATQKKQAEQQLEILKEEKKALTAQFNNALANGVDKASSEFLEMVDALTNVDSSILDCQKSIESFDNSILNLHTEVFNRIQKQFSSFGDELSNMLGLIDDVDVATKDNAWTEAGLAKLGLISQQIELAERQVDQYNDEIAELNRQYNEGKFSATEYADKLIELQSGLWDSANAAESARDAMLETNRARVDIVVKGIEEEIKAFKELIDEQQKALDQEKDLHEHQKTLEEKTKAITKLEREIATMTSTDAATTAKRMQKEAELAKAREDLSEYEYDHSIQVAKDALDKQYEDYEKERNEEIDALNESLNDQEKLISDSLNSVKKNTETIAYQIDQIANKHGVYISDTLTSSWRQGENAIAGYGQALSVQSSAFIANLQTVENKEIELQNQANTTSVAIANTFSNRADNLVDELNRSYYTESNLNIMTQTLHNSLIQTLSGSYNSSGIVNAFNSIASAANSAANAVNNLNVAQGKSPAVYEPNNEPQKSTKKFYIVDSNGNKVDQTGYLTAEEAQKKLNQYMVATQGKVKYSIKQYAKGVHKLKYNQLAWTQEEGQEAILSPSRNAVLTPLKAGDTVLTNDQTENLYKLSKLDPKDLVPISINNMLDNLRIKSGMPTTNNMMSAPILNLDEFIHIDKVDGANIKQVENIAKKAVDQLTKKLYDGMKYGSY